MGPFLAASGAEIGSPGAVAAVPEPKTYGLMLAGLALVGAIARRRKRRSCEIQFGMAVAARRG